MPWFFEISILPTSSKRDTLTITACKNKGFVNGFTQSKCQTGEENKTGKCFNQL